MDDLRILQTVLLDVGLVATLYFGWRIARVYAPELRLALGVMAPWSGATVALYIFGIWTLLQPMQLRGLPDSVVLVMKRSNIRFHVWIVTALLATLAPRFARGDGGSIRLRQAQGPFSVTVFSPPKHFMVSLLM